MGSIMSPLADSPELLAGSPTLHSDLEAHFDVYDEHLDKKKEQLYAHLGLGAGQGCLSYAPPPVAHAARPNAAWFYVPGPPSVPQADWHL